MAGPIQTDGLDKFLRKGGYTGVVLLRRGDDEIFAGAYGLASPRWGIPNTMDMRFDTASITKLFTAVAVLQLVDHKLDKEPGMSHLLSLFFLHHELHFFHGAHLLFLLHGKAGLTEFPGQQLFQSFCGLIVFPGVLKSDNL